MPISDIENTNVALGLHRDPAAKSVSAKTVSGDHVVRRKPLGAVNFQNVNTNACLPSKQSVSQQRQISGALTKKSTTNHLDLKSTNRLKPSAAHVTTKEVVNCIMDVEAMIIAPEDNEDDYHDLWPLHEQPASYLKYIKAWQPPISAGCNPLPPILPPSLCETEFNLVAADPEVVSNPLSTSLPPIEDEYLEYLSCLT